MGNKYYCKNTHGAGKEADFKRLESIFRYTADQWQGLEPRSTRLERQSPNPPDSMLCL